MPRSCEPGMGSGADLGACPLATKTLKNPVGKNKGTYPPQKNAGLQTPGDGGNQHQTQIIIPNVMVEL